MITTKHHDGFALWPSKVSQFNVMDATPFKRDIVGELTKAWCLMSVPLLLGCDLTKLDDFTVGLFTNDEVIAVNQHGVVMVHFRLAK